MRQQSITEDNVLALLHTINPRLWHYSRLVGSTGVIATLEWKYGSFTTVSFEMLYGYANAIVDYYNNKKQNYETTL